MAGQFVAGKYEAHVDIALIKIPIEIGRRQAHFYIGVFAFKIMQTRDEPFEGDCDVDLYGEFIVGVAWSQCLGLGFDLVEGIADGGVISLAELGEFGFARITAEELNIEAVFK